VTRRSRKKSRRLPRKRQIVRRIRVPY